MHFVCLLQTSQSMLLQVDHPRPIDMEGLCTLLVTVGSILDGPRTDKNGRFDRITTGKARAIMDSYFCRIKEASGVRHLDVCVRLMLRVSFPDSPKSADDDTPLNWQSPITLLPCLEGRKDLAVAKQWMNVLP